MATTDTGVWHPAPFKFIVCSQRKGCGHGQVAYASVRVRKGWGLGACKQATEIKTTTRRYFMPIPLLTIKATTRTIVWCYGCYRCVTCRCPWTASRARAACVTPFGNSNSNSRVAVSSLLFGNSNSRAAVSSRSFGNGNSRAAVSSRPFTCLPLLRARVGPSGKAGWRNQEIYPSGDFFYRPLCVPAVVEALLPPRVVQAWGVWGVWVAHAQGEVHVRRTCVRRAFATVTCT